ncbi:cold-shock protein [Pseudomonas sp. IT-P4]|uniref:cold-shock protein n=1 Tax=Pseudomonas sp. IT-P4 TaxID=3026446 RepID=UPI0039E07379
MKIDFGRVERYIEDRGFGFVSHTFIGSPSREVFFHIKSVKRTRPELAQALNSHNSHEPLYFWYEFEISEKGQKVIAILDPTKMRQNHPDNASKFIETIEKSWLNAEISLPETIRKATLDLLSLDEARQLEARRYILEEEKKKEHEELRRAETTRLQEIADQMRVNVKAEEEEFRQLVTELLVLGFTQSKQVSAYIVRQKLGYKYQHISGVLQMGMGGDVWNFNGGFPPRIYARLCYELGLGNQGSGARPLSFTAYKDINER